jgi:hypothetical protein
MLIAQLFFIATMLSHFLLLRCSVIPLAKEAQSFFDTTVLNHFLLLQYSIIFYCYSTQSFPNATALSHSRCCSTQSFLIITAREAAQSFCKITELSHG